MHVSYLNCPRPDEYTGETALLAVCKQALTWAAQRHIAETDRDRVLFPERFQQTVPRVRHTWMWRSARAPKLRETAAQGDKRLLQPLSGLEGQGLGPRRYRGHHLHHCDVHDGAGRASVQANRDAAV